MARSELVIRGHVIDCNGLYFNVQTETHVIRATLSGKMHIHHIRVVPGDEVFVEVSPYALDRGRIVKRTQ